jgi:hypothetical protein
MSYFRLTSSSPIRITRDFYQKDKKGNIKSWSVTETFRSGYLDFTTEQELPYSDDLEFVVDPSICYDYTMNNRIKIEYEFDKTFSDRETEDVERNWNKHGSKWMNNNQNWLVDYESIIVTGPFQVEFIIDSNTKLITLSNRPKYIWS